MKLETLPANRFDEHLDDGRVAHCEEAVRQQYANCCFSAGHVTGIDPDTLYLRLEKDGEDTTTFFLRPDELSAILFVGAGALWAHQEAELSENEGASDDQER